MKANLSSRFLFLQGPASLFFSRLATALIDCGHQVWRINFNGGDRVFWQHRGAVDYLDVEAQWPAFLARYLAEWSITDIVLLGDCRPLHKAAIEIAKANNVNTHIFEEGYIRPNWITLEHSGVNGYSSLPRNIDEFLAASNLLDEIPPPVEVPSNLPRRAIDDVTYSLSTMLLAWRYCNYNRHWPYGQITEYAYGARRLFGRFFGARRRQNSIGQMINTEAIYYVFPMQIDVDSQIRFHSQFGSQAEAIDLIIKSFAHSAPPESKLVITEHPLETSPINWRRVVTEQAKIHGVANRVVFFAGGSPNELLIRSRGIIVLNSTTGHQGLELGIPVIALSRSVFNLAGVTFQGGLDSFWRLARPADRRWIDAYRKVLIHRTQINGGFFTDAGINLAVANYVKSIESKRNEKFFPVNFVEPSCNLRNENARAGSH